MGTLAFDRDRVRVLALRLAEALEALARVPAEPVTADATAVVRAVHSRLAPWHHRLVALTSCGVLEDYRPVAPDPTELLDAHLLALAAHPHWSFSTDPGSAPVDWRRWAGAIGRLLARGDLEALLREDGVRNLREQLSSVARSQDAARELLDELGLNGLVRLVDALATRWRAEQEAQRRYPDRVPSRTPSEAGADEAACLRLLGALLASASRSLVALDVASHAEPYGAAQLLVGTGLHGQVLGWAVATLLVRWARGDTPWWLDRRLLPAPLPDHLLPLVVDDPAAAGVVTDRLIGAGQLAPLLFGGLDQGLGAQVLHAATRPDTTGERAAGHRLLAVLSWLRTEPLWSVELMTATMSDPGLLERWQHVRRALGALVAPWQLHLSGLAPRWGARPETAIEHLVWVADDPHSAAALAAGLAPAVARLGTALPADAARRRAVVDDLALSIGASVEVLRDAETDEWHERRSRLQTVITLANHLPVVSGPVAQAAKQAGLNVLGGWLAGDGDAVADRAITTEQQRLDELAEVLASAVWVDAWRAGRVDASVVARDPVLALELQHARDAVANPAGRGDALAARAAN